MRLANVPPPPGPIELIVTYIPLVLIIGLLYLVISWNHKQQLVKISCPKCEHLSTLGLRPLIQIVCSIFLFPFGLLTLLAGRNPTVCGKCGHRWMT
jgi:hypothetical protein